MIKRYIPAEEQEEHNPFSDPALGCRCLLEALICQALADLRSSDQRGDAYRWLFSNGKEPFSFLYCVEQVERKRVAPSAEAIRRKAKRILFEHERFSWGRKIKHNRPGRPSLNGKQQAEREPRGEGAC